LLLQLKDKKKNPPNPLFGDGVDEDSDGLLTVVLAKLLT
jgi:hypothetical protein